MGSDKSVNIAKAISGLKGCNAASDKLHGVLITINDGALTVKETDSEDLHECTGVESAKEAVKKIDDAVGDGIIIVIASV